MIIIDFETRSHCDLTVEGAWKYAEHPSTEVLCMGYGWSDGGKEYLWTPGAPLPTRFMDDIRDGMLVAAHNAEFDWLIWNNVFAPLMGLPELDLNQMYCTSAMCRVNGMPSSLDKATRCADVTHKKNPNGTRLITKMCKPPYEDTEQLRSEMYEYCRGDIAATRALMDVLRPMTDTERADWVNCAELNDRGVFVDRHLAELATQYAGAETIQIGERLHAMTGGLITKHTQHKRVADYCLFFLTEEQSKLTHVFKDGKLKHSFGKPVRQELLACNDLAIDAREVLEMVDAASKSSVAKFLKMLELSDDDGLLRGAFVYYGASQTGRFSAKGLQLHNFIRDAMDAPTVERMIDVMEAGEAIPDVMGTLSRMLRGAVVPIDDDHTFVVGDWSAIEACALPWLADDSRAEPKLQALRDGQDIYRQEFTGWQGDDRQVHKVIELSFGYGGAVGAFKAMGRNYWVFLPDHEIGNMCKVWRVKNAWAVGFWRKVERAAANAVRDPGTAYAAGRLTYVATTRGVGDVTLLCVLPDDTILTYPDAKFEQDENGRNQLTAIKGGFTPAKGEAEWPRVNLWYGLLVENATQGICAGLLRSKLREVDAVGHIHDEIIVECLEAEAQDVVVELKTLMETCPPWALGLPLRASPKVMWRYGK